MSWEAIGALAETLGAICVMLSMIYLALQIRSSNRLARSEAKIAATSQMTSLLDSFISEPKSSAVWVKGRRNLKDLSTEERTLFDNLALKGFMAYSSQFFQLRIHTIEQDDWAEACRTMQWWLQGEGMREWWRKFGNRVMSDSFREFVDAEIQRIEESSRLPMPDK